ncbi:DUF6268 family outer membrane beta-barrel protein [Pendulispora rubella]|uniref:DUF6268 family outer membrane beta-barrel protein n=1 Tax=Pendulispora rubella TaxID=2741070 RepID=A0ABZ2L6U9_9BACT
MLKTSFAVLAVLAVICGTKSARAQAADSMFSVSYEGSAFGVKKPESRDTKDSLGIQTLRFRAGTPIPLGPKTMFIPGVAYDMLDIPESTSEKLPTGRLHAASVSVGLMQMLSNRIMVGGMVSAGLASDFEERASIDDLSLTASVMGMYKFSDSFSLGLGVSYFHQIRRVFPGPAIALNWELSDRFRIRGAVPASLNVEFRATPWLTLGIREAMDVNFFHLSGRKYGQQDMQLSYITVNVGPKATLNFSDSTHLDLYASVSALRRYEYFVDAHSQRDGTLPAVVTFGARLWFGSAGWRSDPWAPIAK